MTWTSDTRGKVGGGVLMALLGAGIPALVGAALDGHAGQPYRETRLHFAAQHPDGQFARFLDREVTPAFPDGLTVHHGRTQRLDAHGRIARGASYEVVLLYPETEAEERGARIERIRRAYEKEFRQEAEPVGRSDDTVEGGF
ncbi:DUF3574 domain-containing protein [Streptomyces sp. RerS4]|uniref:DUF3574 domain-containing protein n=1 Tax=Streptomyces sp. RerS4 TaxID=2942449 RepID=UPI00201C5EC3|nr:DUF3574 domain-containing protein [Streptomyces sp. RerS4]UQX02478.1 DUF3574 domain-containing protein [Streptomyces sp. RerS4]